MNGLELLNTKTKSKDNRSNAFIVAMYFYINNFSQLVTAQRSKIQKLTDFYNPILVEKSAKNKWAQIANICVDSNVIMDPVEFARRFHKFSVIVVEVYSKALVNKCKVKISPVNKNAKKI